MKPELLKQAPVSTRGNLNVERIGSMLVAFPPKPFQAEIVSRIESETTAINTALTKSTEELSLLQEYRTRLIADVVTGKLDVREAVKTLPAITDDSAADDLEPEDEDSEEVEAGDQEGE